MADLLNKEVVTYLVSAFDVVVLSCYVVTVLVLSRFLRGKRGWIPEFISVFRAIVCFVGLIHFTQIVLFWRPMSEYQVLTRGAAATFAVLASFFLYRNISKFADMKTSREAQEMIDDRVRDLEDQAEMHRLADSSTRKAVERVLRDFSHDLKEPVRAIGGFTELLLNEDFELPDEKRKEFIQRCNRSANRIMTMMDEMRAYIMATVKSEDLSVRFVPFSMVLGDSLERVDVRRERRGALIDVECHVPEDVYLAESVIRVFQNILVNAIKYSRMGSEPKILVTAKLEGGDVFVEVKDNGIGFDVGESSFIFEPFQRISRRSDWPGVGMGLTIARDVVRSLGGRIWAHSDGPGKGSSFFFRVPARRGHGETY